MKKNIILGIVAFNHDSSACLIMDNKLVAFCEEERFNGVKHTGAFPTLSIDYCLQKSKCTIQDVTDVAFYFNPKECIAAYFLNNNPFMLFIDPSIFLSGRFYFEIVWLLGFVTNAYLLNRYLGNSTAKVYFMNHHLTHIWYGYYASGFSECIVLSNDSVGESISTLATKFQLDEGEIVEHNLIVQHDPHSLGYLYGAVTEFLGFKRGEGEGRVMALASYGTNKYTGFFRKGFDLKGNGKFKLCNNLISKRSFQPKGKRLSKKFYQTFGFARKSRDKLKQIHFDIAHALQASLETIEFHQLDYLSRYTKNIVLTGGVAQNSVMNGLATNKYTNHHFFVPPIPHDAGCSIGAAVNLHYKLLGKLPETTDSAFLGPDYETESIISILKNNQIAYKILNSPVKYCVEKLSENKVVGLFRGRMECGPRALCNRSILASPISIKMRDHLNDKVKFREHFRPYGGFALPKKIDCFLVHNSKYKEGPYMTYVYEVKKDWIKKIPSLVHEDGTCRIQIINESDDFLTNLLESFETKTGVPLLINTSMNLRGFPIANTPTEALQTFYSSAMDAIIFNEKILIEK
ncbi:MAG: carbamoyltransferase C-terminal domain-containing protein [Candidatus Woesebacteria bacterium]